jgi:hypothetical protein
MYITEMLHVLVSMTILSESFSILIEGTQYFALILKALTKGLCVDEYAHILY